MRQATRERASERPSPAARARIGERIAALRSAALRFVPPARVAETVQRWLDHANGAWGERDPAQLFAAATVFATDLALFAPSASGTTAIDRLARQHKPADPDEAAAIAALRGARFRLARIVARDAADIVRLQDLVSGETLSVVDAQIPESAAGCRVALRTGALPDGRHALAGAITPLDDTACAVALGLHRPNGQGLSNPQRCAEAVYRHILRHGGLVIAGLNAPPEGALDPETCDLLDIAQDWARSISDAAPPDSMMQRVRDLTSLDSLLDVLAACVLAREQRRERLAGVYTRIAAIQLETVRLREANGVAGLTLAAVSAAIAQAIGRHGMPAAVRALFEELRGSGARKTADAGDIDLERLVARIQALRAKTVEQGCTEAEAIAAAEKVATLLDRYGLSLDTIELRRQACQGIGIDTGRRRLAPIDDCVPSIAAFFDCRAWAEKRESAPIRHIFFGLRPDVAAAHYLYDLIARAFATETAAFTRDGVDAGLDGGARRSAAHSFQIGLARGIVAKLHRLRAAREAALSSSGRDLVPIKSAVVDDELARLGLRFRPGSRAARRRVVTDAFAAGHEAGSRFEIQPGLAASA